MKKLITMSLVSFAAVGTANAFGYFRNADVYDFIGMSGFGVLSAFGIVALLLGALLFIFWLLMLIDCLKRDFKKDYEKVVWVLVMIFLHILGAIIYYFVVKVSDKRVAKKK